jgi:hypothetical protein
MDLLGWDTVFVGTLDTVNQALARCAKELLQTFSYTEDEVSLAGTFGAWSIVPGGSGELLHLRLPVASGRLTGNAGSAAIDLTGIGVVLQVPLQWLGVRDRPNAKALAFDFRKVAGPGSNDPASVQPVLVQDPAGRLTRMQMRAFGHAVAQCLAAQRRKSFVCPRQRRPGQPGHGGMAPSSRQRICICRALGWDDPGSRDLEHSDKPRHLILAAQHRRPAAAGRPQQRRHRRCRRTVHASDRCAGYIAAGLKIGPERLATGNDGLIRSKGPIDLRLPAGSSVPLSSVTASLNDARITLTYRGGFSPQRGVNMTYSATSELELSIDPASLALSFRNLGTTIKKDIQKEWWVRVLEVLGSLTPATMLNIVIDMLLQQVSTIAATQE